MLLALAVVTSSAAAPDPAWQNLSSKQGNLPAPPGGSTNRLGAVVVLRKRPATT